MTKSRPAALIKPIPHWSHAHCGVRHTYCAILSQFSSLLQDTSTPQKHFSNSPGNVILPLVLPWGSWGWNLLVPSWWCFWTADPGPEDLVPKQEKKKNHVFSLCKMVPRKSQTGLQLLRNAISTLSVFLKGEVAGDHLIYVLKTLACNGSRRSWDRWCKSCCRGEPKGVGHTLSPWEKPLTSSVRGPRVFRRGATKPCQDPSKSLVLSGEGGVSGFGRARL